ncbi:hypothetical protein FQN54_009851 [Arachnomyces sp. PD_36]|nr:hypothetical protein FQN54_009851 [Arachnomyces sp. PD_36]
MLRARRRTQVRPSFIAVAIVFAIYFIFFAFRSDDDDDNGHEKPKTQPEPVKVEKPESKVRQDLVVASMKGDDTSWLYEHFPSWHKSIYVVNDETAELTVRKNKGRESMVYLTYIIDNYDKLPDYMLFIHSLRYQWHNDDPLYDGVPVLRNFQLPYLEKEGYVNARCAWTLGCPSEIKPFQDTHRQDVHVGEYYKNGFMELFPGAKVPEAVGVSCCAQFGVTRSKVRERPRSEYERYREWLLETPLADDLSGRIMEYSWHMIFNKEAVHCPTAQDCYCNVFGLCDLTCNRAGDCEGRYTLPPYSTMPQGWPEKGWDGKPMKKPDPE